MEGARRNHGSRIGLVWTLLCLALLLTSGATLAHDHPEFESGPLGHWEWRNPLPQGNPLRCVIHAEDRFLAIGDATTLTSEDSGQWEHQTSTLMPGDWCLDLVYAEGIYVGAMTGESIGLAYSDDGLDWTHVPGTGPALYYGLAHGDGRFVAVGHGVASSSDGRTWAHHALSLPGTPLLGAAHGGGLFVAVGMAGVMVYSNDGETWEFADSVVDRELRDVAYGAGVFVAVGAGGTILRSQDGQDWDAMDSPVGRDLHRVAHDGRRFVAVGQGGTVLVSADGRGWQVRGAGTENALYDLAFGPDRGVAVGNFGEIVLSPDARNWRSLTARRSATQRDLLAIARDGRRFVAVGANGAIVTSEDGVRWRARHSGTASWLRGVTVGNRLFVAVGNNGRILTSPNGVGWARRASPTEARLNAVTFGDGQFVAVGAGGTILTSRNGREWTARDSGIEDMLLGVAYGNGRFVAVGGRDPGVVLTSSDGVNWAQGELDWSEEGPRAIAFGNGVFVAVGAIIGEAYAARSEDGLRWERATPVETIRAVLDGIVFAHGTFLTVGETAFHPSPVFASTDGRTWVHHGTPTVNLLTAAAYGAGTFVVTGPGGTILQSDVYPAARPSLSPRPGNYRGPQTVTLTTATEGALIRYTTDGSRPTRTHGTEIASGDFVTIDSTATLRAIAYKPGWGDSELAEGRYRIQPRR